MAGAGYKLFVNGNTLSASDLNTYVQQQTVMVFATTGARDTALSGVLAEGMQCYITGTGGFYYNGSAWVANVSASSTTTFTNKTLTSPIISGTVSGTTILQGASAASGTLTLPAATDTLVGKATTDTLTNKTLTAPVISTIVNTGTLTLPTSTDTLVGKATTDTLTNKTLTSPVINSPSLPLLTTTGDTLYASSASTPARLGIGSTGQVLTVASGLPSWATPATGGGMTVLASGTLSGASISLSSISQSYKNLQLVLRNQLMTTGEAVRIRFNGDTGTSYYQSSTNTVNLQSWNSTWFFPHGSQDTTTSQGQIVVDFLDYTNTSTWKEMSGLSICNRTGAPTQFDVQRIAGWWYASNGASAITDIQLRTDTSAGFVSGSYILYGVK
jgi:hypothetical protein